MDMKNDFLYGVLFEQVLMEQPLRYVAQENNTVCRLKKAIYGLKQSPRAWKFSRIIMGIDFRRCADHSIFIRKKKYGCAILVVYIDDILLTGSDSGYCIDEDISGKSLYYERYEATKILLRD